MKNLERHEKLTKDFQALFKDLLDEGFFNPSPFRVFLRFLEIVTYFSFATYFASLDGFSRIVPVFCIACGWVRSGFAQHEGGHGSFTGNPKYDKWFHVLYYSESYY